MFRRSVATSIVMTFTMLLVLVSVIAVLFSNDVGARPNIRSAFFVDAGNVFSTNCRSYSRNCFSFDMAELRYSVGFGVTWLTGLGPMTFSIAKPFNAGEFDEEESFQFELGRSF